MTKNIYKTLLASVAAVLLFAGCDTNNAGNADNSFDAGITTNSSSWGSQLTDIPAEYDSVGMAFGEYMTTVSLALIDRGISNPTIDDVKYEAKKFFKEKNPSASTSLIDSTINSLDISAVSTDVSSMTKGQQAVLDQLHTTISNTNKNVFEQQIPTMVSLIYTLPEAERGALFVYLSIIKHGVLADREMSTAIGAAGSNGFRTQSGTYVTQGFWKSFICNMVCTLIGAVWGGAVTAGVTIVAGPIAGGWAGGAVGAAVSSGLSAGLKC